MQIKRLPSDLTPIQRILLLTDGTVTDILETYLQEPIEMLKLNESSEHASHTDAILQISTETPVIHRHTLLRGKTSKKGLLLASSTLVPSRLPDNLRKKIEQPDTAIGQAIKASRVETFREILDITILDALTPTQQNQPPFNLLSAEYNAELFLLQRTYCIRIQGKPCMLIHERFSSDLL